MPHVHAVRAAGTLAWTLASGERDRLPCNQRHHLDARLHARTLLGQNEFTAFKIASRLRVKYRDLNRKDMFPVKVLMQVIVAAGAVAQKQRRGPRLASENTTISPIVAG